MRPDFARELAKELGRDATEPGRTTRPMPPLRAEALDARPDEPDELG